MGFDFLYLLKSKASNWEETFIFLFFERFIFTLTFGFSFLFSNASVFRKGEIFSCSFSFAGGIC